MRDTRNIEGGIGMRSAISTGGMRDSFEIGSRMRDLNSKWPFENFARRDKLKILKVAGWRDGVKTIGGMQDPRKGNPLLRFKMHADVGVEFHSVSIICSKEYNPFTLIQNKTKLIYIVLTVMSRITIFRARSRAGGWSSSYFCIGRGIGTVTFCFHDVSE